MPGRVPEQVLEGQLVGLPVAGKERGKTLAQQLPTLFQHKLELLDAGSSVEIMEHIRLPAGLDCAESQFQRTDAASEKPGVDLVARSVLACVTHQVLADGGVEPPPFALLFLQLRKQPTHPDLERFAAITAPATTSRLRQWHYSSALARRAQPTPVVLLHYR